MQKREQKSPSLALTALALVFIGLAAFVMNTYCSGAVGYASVFSASLNSPTSALRTLMYSEQSAQSTVAEAGYETKSVTKEAELVSASDPVYKTPDDILLMKEEFRAVYGEAAHDGEIVKAVHRRQRDLDL